MTPIDPIALAVMIAAILERLGIPYVIGGSVASSVMSEPRSTLDLDLMIDATADEVRHLVTALGERFYVDEDDAVAAAKSAGAFNAIHFESSMKVDFFLAEPLGRRQIARRRAIEVRPGVPPLYFYSPEDLVIRKVLWYRAGGETSSRQWRDVVSILKAATQLDRSYLLAEADVEGLADLLERALREAGA